MDGLFKNIGGKIKKLAKVIFVLEVIFFLIKSIASFVESGNYYDNYYVDVSSEYFVVLGVVYLFLGPIISLVSAWMLYGFGELIDKTTDNNRQLRELRNTDSRAKSNQAAASAEKATSPNVNTVSGKCDECLRENIDVAEYRIQDSYGIRYRKLCNDCKAKMEH